VIFTAINPREMTKLRKDPFLQQELESNAIFGSLDNAFEFVEQEILTSSRILQSKWFIFDKMKQLHCMSSWQSGRDGFDEILDVHGETLRKYCSFEILEKGTVLYRASETLTHVYILENGKITLTLVNKFGTGVEKIVTITKGALCGALISPISFESATLVAKSCVIAIPLKSLEQMRVELPDVWGLLNNECLKFLLRVQRMMEYHLFQGSARETYLNILKTDEEKLHRPLQILVAIANAVSQGNFRSSEPRTSDSEMKMAIPLLRLSKERIAELQEFHLSKFGSLETKIPFSEISLSLMELGYYVPDDKLEELEKSLGYGVTDLTHSQFVALFQRVAFFETSAVDRAKIPLFFRRYDNDHFTVGLNELYSMIEDIHAGHFSREDVFRTLELWCEEKRQHELDFSEFCSMLAYASALANIEHLDPEFKKFSSDGEKITLQDLVTALERYCGVTLTRNEAEDMIAEADVDGKGFVSLQDFVNLCKRVYNPDEIAFWEWRSKSPHVHKKSLVY